ncbi:MAG: ArsA family ATPase [Cyanobacteria bacterium REEB459]|nr:ArsA family ATPase [Cyanobacteria bacterium REEB459]
MAQILTFLGKGGCGSTTYAIATAKQLAAQGRRVLLMIQDVTPAPGLVLGAALGPVRQEIEPQLWALQVHTTDLLEHSWDSLKALEGRYLRTPFLKDIYGQELAILPGMDEALALNALREYDASGDYDVIVYDGNQAMATLRMFGLPEVLDWYVRRFRGVFQQSDLVRTVSPLLQPIAATVLAVDWSGDLLEQPTGEVRSLLQLGRDAVSDPQRVLAFLVTTPAAAAIATARYLWGSAQQIGLTVAGVLVHQGALGLEYEQAFAPLPHFSMPEQTEAGWGALMANLPDPQHLAQTANRATVVDLGGRVVKLFLPSFDKSQVKLTQSGPEVTVQAGNQRRNLALPSELQGKSVTGARFQDQYLVISFA